MGWAWGLDIFVRYFPRVESHVRASLVLHNIGDRKLTDRHEVLIA